MAEKNDIPEMELEKRFWLRVETKPFGYFERPSPVTATPSSSVPFRATHRLFLLTNHKPSAKLLGGGKWKLYEKRNA